MNGETETFNDDNVRIWKGEIKNNEKWNGYSIFDWKDKKRNEWGCSGKYFKKKKKKFKFIFLLTPLFRMQEM